MTTITERACGVFQGGTPGRGRAPTSKPSGSVKLTSFSVRTLPDGGYVQKRRLYRSAHQRLVHEELKLATMNCQHLNPWRTDNKLKLQQLVLEARHGNWHICMLSDLANRGNGQQLHVLCVEEFVLIIRGCVGLLLDQALAKAWQLAGAQHFCIDTCPRLLAITVKLHGQVYALGSAYVPTQAFTQERLDVFEAARGTMALLPQSISWIWGGDWNSHFGKDSVGWDWVGGHVLQTPTSALSYQLQEWAKPAGLRHVDSYVSFRSGKRGTWFRTHSKQYYENDYFLSTLPTGFRRWRKASTFAAAFGDHYGKVITLLLPGRVRAREAQLDQRAGVPSGFLKSGFDGQIRSRRPLRLDLMRGPSEEAVEQREIYARKVEQHVSAALGSSSSAMPSVPIVCFEHCYTDGSCHDQRGAASRQGPAG
jgi:hypothetical protein